MSQALILGLDHVQLSAPAGCEAAARAFFSGMLGLPELQKPQALLANGGVWFGLPDGRQLHIGVAQPFSPALKAHPCLRCANLDAMMAHLTAQGVVYEQDFRLETRRIYLADPWGNRLEIVEGEHESEAL